ncbi:hypothetical protein QYE76_026821 [Lolium multiflorum]|uniref:Uncharacterized protein n=1 Tax=Lolium multiflorum TaxID=4521 RepID=A0AAD8VVZ5_LOLMU|nr:hypothetical protein QYE76_026821 [Lolium multiflorum]
MIFLQLCQLKSVNSKAVVGSIFLNCKIQHIRNNDKLVLMGKMQLERWTLMVSTMRWCFSPVKLRQRNEDASGFDDEMRSIVASNLEGRGIRLHPATNLTQLSKTAADIEVVTDKGLQLCSVCYRWLYGTAGAEKLKKGA